MSLLSNQLPLDAGIGGMGRAPALTHDVDRRRAAERADRERSPAGSGVALAVMAGSAFWIALFCIVWR